MSRSKHPLHIARPGAILAILALINFINYTDRQVISALVVYLQAPLARGGLALSDNQAALLQTAFMLVHSVASIPLGMLADSFLRKRLIAAGVGLWSVATALAAAAGSFASLFVARGAVGIGEASYAPAASSLISEKFKPEARARALTVFQIGMVMGGGAAAVVGGQIGGHYGWRAAFLVVGLPGLLLALLVLFMDEPPVDQRPVTRGESAAAHASLTFASLKTELSKIVRSPALFWINVAGVLVTFFFGAVIFWAPAFIVRYHYGNDSSAAGHVSTVFGLLAVCTAIPGAFTGGFLADRWEKRQPGAGRLQVIALGPLLASPMAVIGFFTNDTTVLYLAIGLGVFFSSWYVGPILAALHDVVTPGERGTMTGIYLLLIHLLGDAISPTIVSSIGTITGSLRVGLAAAVVLLAAGGLAALRAIPESKRLAKLKQAAPTG